MTFNLARGGGEIVVSVPNISVGTYTYNEELQGPSFLGLDPGRCTITDQKKINAGQYTMSIALNNTTNMKWADGTTSPKTCNYEISKIEQTISTEITSVALTGEEPSVVVQVAGVEDVLKATSSDSTIASVNVNGSSVTITGIKNGNATVTLVAPGSTNYAQSNIITIDVSASMLVIGSFGSLTDSQLVALVEAADAGEIDLYEDAGWRVGDERIIQLNDNIKSINNYSTSAVLVLMNKGGYSLTNPTPSGRTTCSFVVGVKYGVGQATYSDVETDSWKDSTLRSLLNTTFKNSIPSTLINMFKSVKVITAKSCSSSEYETTNDYFFVPAVKEISGRACYSNTVEANALSQYTFFVDSANRQLKDSYPAMKYNAYWWTRSPGKKDSQTGFCSIIPSGSDLTNPISRTSLRFLRPIGCI